MESVKNNTVGKNKTANAGGKYSYRYTDLAQIHDYLAENNMSYYQYIDRLEGEDYIMTVKVIDGKERMPLRGSKVVDATLVGVSNPAQVQGSAISYARRYSLLMAFGLATDDDDAESLSQEVKKLATDKQIAIIRKKADKERIDNICKYYKVDELEQLTISEASETIKILNGGK